MSTEVHSYYIPQIQSILVLLCSNTISTMDPGLQLEYLAASKIQTERNIQQSSDLIKNQNMLKEKCC